MVRRTKADAEATRHSLLDAAEHLFQERGVSRTSLNDIAITAGTTRGAIYWHFKDKADLFNAMMERVVLPLEETLNKVGKTPSTLSDPLQSLRDSIAYALHKTATDERTRRVFEIATLQVEYNDEMHAVRARRLQCRNDCMQQTAEVLKSAANQQRLTLAIPVQSAALGLHVMIDGLIQNWLLDPQAFDLRRCGRQVVDAFLSGLGFPIKAGKKPPVRHTTRAPTKASTPAPIE
ncbi:TetR family transcriptional regulator [Hydrogenophaga sp. A37]|uniref:TetR family transcriptional regulator n=1 Tax=Hydrogenophaga sp. A37 TaxID=1945864 RepID=UPI0009871FD1|nr:TetR family transcriptional regulator [Hydrogenophaga sp. A37]OOG86040.1 TetR family transcriptional regulator [Hydrogenophaga sp. A37]